MATLAPIPRCIPIINSCLFLLYLAFWAIPVKAQNKIDYDEIYNQCVEESGTINNSVVLACSGKTFQASQQEIDNLYQKIFSQLLKQSPEDAQKFQIAHQSWSAYRDKSCEIARSYIGSPMSGFCPMKKNISRVEELRELENSSVFR